MLNTSGQAVAGWRHEQMTAVGSLKDKFHWTACAVRNGELAEGEEQSKFAA